MTNISKPSTINSLIMFSDILDIRFYQITAFTCNLNYTAFCSMLRIRLRGMFTWEVFIAQFDSLSTWLFLQRILILDVNLYKTARIRYLRHIILLFLWSYYQVYDSGEFWQVVSMAFHKFTFSGCNLRSSLDPNMLSVTYNNSCCY